jgi:cytoskeleton protein RodZ
MQTIGERLEEARKRKGISIREASEATKVRGDYLHKFESNQFDIKLPDIYLRGFLRLYANFLKLSGEKILNDLDALGLGEGGRPSTKGVNREIYGKMDIGHGSAASGGSGPRSNSADTAPSSTAASMTPGTDTVGGPKRPPFQPRMPLGGIGRALETKSPWMLAVGAVLVVVLLIWSTVALVGGGHSTSTPAAPVKPATAAVETEPQVIIIAVRPVQITAVKDRLDGHDLAPPRSLAAGERYPLANADMLVTVSDRAAVQFSFKEVTYDARDSLTGVLPTGPGVLKLNFTAQR